ncbi:MAG TPA: hemolysin family protein [Sphingomonadaceae bacterium]|nr:hemolysin family protein [Sphingomonadaceae bacterium]
MRTDTIAGDDEEPSRSSTGGSRLWRGMRALIFGEDSEPTLRDQIEEAIDEHEGEVPVRGDLSAIERQMLRNLLHFGDLTAGEISVPRGDIMAVPHTVSFAELMTAFTEAGHSRLPVYEGELDTITGMIHVKDVFARAQAGDHPDDISSLVRVPLFVPESMGVLDLLARMRAQRIHLAIVVDEFGGTEGLVTIEDVVEEIVGDIEDEHDDENVGMLHAVEDGIWDADARAELEDVGETIDPRLAVIEEDVDTLGGLAFLLAGRVLAVGDSVAHPSGWRLEVTEADARRVTRLRLHAPVDADGGE